MVSITIHSASVSAPPLPEQDVTLYLDAPTAPAVCVGVLVQRSARTAQETDDLVRALDEVIATQLQAEEVP